MLLKYLRWFVYVQDVLDEFGNLGLSFEFYLEPTLTRMCIVPSVLL